MVLQNTLTIAVGLGNLNEVWVSQAKMNIFYHIAGKFMFKLMSCETFSGSCADTHAGAAVDSTCAALPRWWPSLLPWQLTTIRIRECARCM